MSQYTESELEKKTINELKSLADDNLIDIVKGWKKPDLIQALLEINDEDEPELDLEDELDDEEPELDIEEEDDLELPEEDEELDEEVDEAPAPKKAARAKKPKEEKSGDTLAAKQVATILSENLKTQVDAKTLRQFFRSSSSTTEAVGSGGRYEFAIEDIQQIQDEFEAWKTAHASRGAKRGPKAGGGKASSSQVIEEVEEIEELELDEEIELDDELEEDDLELED